MTPRPQPEKTGAGSTPHRGGCSLGEVTGPVGLEAPFLSEQGREREEGFHRNFHPQFCLPVSNNGVRAGLFARDRLEGNSTLQPWQRSPLTARLQALHSPCGARCSGLPPPFQGSAMPPAAGPSPARGSAQELRSGSLQTHAFLKAPQGSSPPPRPPGRQTERAKARVGRDPMPSRGHLEAHGS